MSFLILINKNAGNVATQGEKEISRQLKTVLNNQIEKICFLSPPQLINILKTMEPGNKTLLIGGGDGTFVSAAAILKERGIPFGLLPFGTMNLLCKDLGVPRNFLEAAKAYLKSQTINIDTCKVNNRLFLCNAMIGIPTELARKREARREETGVSMWLDLFHNILQKLLYGKKHIFILKYKEYAQTSPAKAVIISNNPYSPAPGTQSIFKKRSLHGGKLGIYTVTPDGTRETIQLLFNMILGNWQEDPCIEENTAQSLELYGYRRKVSVLLDGEIHHLNSPLKFCLSPCSLEIIIPANISFKEAA